VHFLGCHGNAKARQAESPADFDAKLFPDQSPNGRYCRELPTSENTLLAFDPISRTVPTTITRITASITAYSAISWPLSSLPRLFQSFCKVIATGSVLLLRFVLTAPSYAKQGEVITNFSDRSSFCSRGWFWIDSMISSAIPAANST